MQITTSPTAQWATEGTEYPYRGAQQKTWTARQLAASNGAYGGKTVTFIEATAGVVTGELRRVTSSSEKPGNVLVLVKDRDDSDWYTVPNDTLIAVA
jgi:hypothetical protein